MVFFNLFLQFSIYLSVFLTAIMIFLSINKMWSRKHLSVVADSISVSAQFISLITIVPFLLNYSIKRYYWDAGFQFLSFIYTIFLILTGMGIWVRENKYLGIWQKLLKNVRQEKNEFGTLLLSLKSMNCKNQLLTILYYLVWLDDELNEKEREYLKLFIQQLEIDLEIDIENKPLEQGIERINKLYNLIQKYLTVEPPIEQVYLLSDLMQVLMTTNDKITLEEELVANEIASMIDAYIKIKNQICYGNCYRIIIHPKNEEQEKAICEAIPEAEKQFILGDCAFIRSFYTRSYAELISKSYHKRGWFTVVCDTSNL